MKQQVIEDVNIMPQLDRACGLDMHKDKIVGFISCKDGSNQEFRELGTYTCELKEIRDWLQENDIHHCLMESTGIYWISLYAILLKQVSKSLWQILFISSRCQSARLIANMPNGCVHYCCMD